MLLIQQNLYLIKLLMAQGCRTHHLVPHIAFGIPFLVTSFAIGNSHIMQEIYINMCVTVAPAFPAVNTHRVGLIPELLLYIGPEP